ncbi:Uncharacterised protein [Staphylococcus saccharolyticus]|uniref:Uncharacterized protein n=1 Tax=Staphylococcus saccharolyticus TaxID=33028 RepID=A0A380H9Z5_9STAP|nr:Uncharacterised protein [Staphylococcus saccharolyticus]
MITDKVESLQNFNYNVVLVLCLTYKKPFMIKWNKSHFLGGVMMGRS